MALKVSKLVTRMTPADLTEYLIQHSVGTPFHRTTVMRAPITRGLKRLLPAFDDNRYIIALIIDRLLDVGWPGSERGISESMTTFGIFDFALREMGGSQQPWKYMYFRRFRETLEERDFFVYYLGSLENCLIRNLGSQPVEYPKVTWQSKEQDALEHLEKAAQVIEGRLEEKGSLTEWVSIGERPRDESLYNFIHNPDRHTLLPSRSDDVITS